MRARSVGANLTAATATTLFTVPTGYYAKCVLLHASNNGSSNKHISFTWYDSSASLSIPITNEYTLTSKATYAEIDVNQYIVMEEGDYLTATSESGSTISVIATFEVEGAQRT
jgi:hypothetical protein